MDCLSCTNKDERQGFIKAYEEKIALARENKLKQTRDRKSAQCKQQHETGNIHGTTPEKKKRKADAAQRSRVAANAKKEEAAAALTATCTDCKGEKQRKEYSRREWETNRPKAVCTECAKSMFCRGCQTRRPLAHFSRRQKRDHRHDGLAMCKTNRLTHA